MRDRIVTIFTLVTLMSTAVNCLGGTGGIQRLTSSHRPANWELFPIPANPMSPTYFTELSVPKPVRLSIEVYLHSRKDSTRSLVRRIAEPGDREYQPAVYRLDWDCRCDSLDLPSSGGIYTLVVRAYEGERQDHPVYQDSIKFIALENSWDNVDIRQGDYSVTVLRGWTVAPGQSLQRTDVIEPYPRVSIRGAKVGHDPGAGDSAGVVVISLADSLDSHRRGKTFQNGVRGYKCIADSSSETGYKIIGKTEAFRGLADIWALSHSDGKFLLLDLRNAWPIVLDASKLIERLKTSGELH